jgi:probable F420-dependent oxidoreductase
VTGLKVGFGLPVSGSWATVDNLTEVARRADQLGYHSLWTFQRLLHPAQGDWGPMYRAVQDPIVSLAYAAAVTGRARLGVAVLNAPFYSPIVLAKQLTTLDLLSRGRLDVGLGLGWAAEEFTATGADRARRGARMEEFIAALVAIWTEDPVEYVGDFYRMPASHVRPLPAQRPHPPILLGGGAEPALRRVGRLADGWLSASRHDLATVGRDIALMKRSAEQSGRDADALRFIVRAVIARTAEPDGSPDRRPLHGSAEQIRADLTMLASQGVTEAFLDLNFAPDIGSPEADPERSMDQARETLELFAPNR